MSPPTEAEVVAALRRLSPQHFLRKYVSYARRRTDAPLVFHLLTGLAALQTTLPNGFALAAQGSEHKLNLWTLLIGGSGRTRKSACVKLASGILRESECPALASEDPESPEGLVEALKEKPTQLVVYPEYADFLSRTSQDGYMRPMRDLMLKASDGEPLSRRLANKRKISAPDHNMSVLAGVNQQLLDSYVLRRDFTSGFMSRWLVGYGVREREYPPDLPDEPEARLELVEWLRDRYANFELPDYSGFDPDLTERWHGWALATERRGESSIMDSTYARAPAAARKLAALIAWGDPCVSREGIWRVTEDHLEAAISTAEMHLRSMEIVVQRLANTPEEQWMERVFAATSQDPGNPTPESVLLRESKLLDQKFDSVIRTLKRAKRIEPGDKVRGESTYVQFGFATPPKPLDLEDDKVAENVIPFTGPKKAGAEDEVVVEDVDTDYETFEVED